jgi:hypothetical protein
VELRANGVLKAMSVAVAARTATPPTVSLTAVRRNGMRSRSMIGCPGDSFKPGPSAQRETIGIVGRTP